MRFPGLRFLSNAQMSANELLKMKYFSLDDGLTRYSSTVANKFGSVMSIAVESDRLVRPFGNLVTEQLPQIPG